MKNQITAKCVNFVLVAVMVCGNFAAFGQTRRGTKTLLTKKVADTNTSACRGGWSGIVTFTKTRNYAHNTEKTNSASFGTKTHKVFGGI